MKVRIRQEGHKFYVIPAESEGDQAFDMSLTDTSLAYTFVEGQHNFKRAASASEGTFFTILLPETEANVVQNFMEERGLSEDEAFTIIVHEWLEYQQLDQQNIVEAMRGG